MNTVQRPNTWLYIIIISFTFICIAIGITIKVAVVDFPVEMDDTYRENYHDVDLKINEIIEMEQQFQKQGYQITPHLMIKTGTNTAFFELTQKDVPVPNANFDLIITREATRDDDLKIGVLKFKNNRYETNEFTLRKPGVWVFNLKIKLNDFTIYRKYYRTITTGLPHIPENNARKRIIKAQQE